MNNTPIISVSDLTLHVAGQSYVRPAVSHVNFDLHEGKTLALLGESGSGKSLTSLAIMGLLPAMVTVDKQSAITYQQRNILHHCERERRALRGTKMAMIFQEPMTALNPVLTVGQQIAEKIRYQQNISAKQAKAQVVELFSQVQLPRVKQLFDEYPHQLSGGMRQRIIIAMALALEPDILIADEPTSALDVTVQYQILELLQQLQQKNRMTLLFITHDLGVARKMADEVAVMYAGQLIEHQSGANFFAQPMHPYSQALFASLPKLNKRGGLLTTLEGRVPSLSETLLPCPFANRCPHVMTQCEQQQAPRRSLGQPLSQNPGQNLNPTTHTNSKAEQQEKNWYQCHLEQPQLRQVSEQPTQKKPDLAYPTSEQHTLHPSPILTVKNMQVSFAQKRQSLFKPPLPHFAVDDISFNLYPGQCLAVVGESGCGKTTLAKALMGLYAKQPRIQTRGQIILANQPTLSAREFKRRVQIVFQDPFSSMNPRWLIADIISEGLVALGHFNKTQRQEKVAELLSQVGLSPEIMGRYPHEFSGGQRQRISIARALAVEPDIIICDEPTSALDVSIQAQLLNLLKELQWQRQLSYLFITHNMSVVSYLADDILVMQKGKIVEKGKAEQILSAPKQKYTQQLIHSLLN